MTSISQNALSGLAFAQRRLEVSAHNLANAATEGFQRQEVRAQAAPGGGVTFSVVRSEQPSSGLFIEDVVEQLQAKQAFLANVQSLRTEDQLIGSLLDIRA
ncbi:flagellar basal body protein [Pseudomarimonas arenosa]|uniref:Flagellar basal body rod protein n=1 Tax=Pseudomarimonas arenosa TaxID=2774145 RepID=A0AAW3ZH39_9GAMM|nr:flagellar basal body protein [Pseudomarimonas arenosa]MBD8525128.1 flagellar basal body rod protein [Pseudomarimonas arenosa]